MQDERSEKMYIIVLTGMPASGKSTFAGKLSTALNLPILEKDSLKETLFDTLGFENYSQKRKLDHAANALLLSVCESMIKNRRPVILDNNFDSISAQALNTLLHKYDCECVTVVFGGETDAFYKRYIQRDNLHERHLGHILQERFPPAPGDSLDYEMTREEFDNKFVQRGMKDFNCDCQTIELDATNPDSIDCDAVVAEICKRLNIYPAQ